MTDDPIEALSAERDRAITDACAEASQVMHRMMRDYSMRPEEAAQAVLDFFAAAFVAGECVHGRRINEHGWADCVECEAGDPDGTLPADPGTVDGVHVTVELWVSSEHDDPVAFVRQRVLRDTETAYSTVSILDVWREDPE